MARRSQCSDSGDNPLDPNYLPPHYREEYRLAIDALIEEDVDGYYKFLQFADVMDFLAPSEIEYIQTSIQLPKQSAHPEHRYFDPTGDGSSDTYWPMHSDLDAPGLDLGWPQIHHFIGPTEVTTLVNPSAPDMPSIKEQARRLIKSAQMVIAVVMDVFTDVDIFADILNAAMRNVAVYLLLDEANVQHFINMVNNYRVNLEAIQFLRVRTVTGISYHCRTGKSFKGQMLDRFILTDCRAVLSGNYSFMWSYEKLHRCMAHLFLGQLVSTFDEEFRILFAQSEPLDLQKIEDLTVLPKRSYLGERPMLRGKYTPGQPEEWNRPTYEENVDWRMAPVKRQEPFHGPLDIYNRYPSPQSRLDPQTRLEPPFDQGPPRIMEGLAHKRHSFAEGGPGRYGLPYQQPGLPEVEPPGRQFYRGQQHLHPGHEPDYGGYGQTDKFWNQEFPQEELHPDQGYPREMDPQNFDPVLNYLSSTRNVDIEQSSDKLIPGPDLPYVTTHPRRHIGQPYACQTSPTPSNTTEKKFMPDYSSDRKDPTVKKGLRNWRISSYLSAYDDSGEPEGLPMGQNVDPFDDFPNPIQQPTPPPPQAVDLAVSKIPNVREYKVSVLPRASQMPAYGKTTQRNVPKKIPDEIPQIMVVPEPKAPTPTPSESSDGEKQEETEPREPIVPVLKRDDSFRGKYNAAGLGISRLRSSLIFKSLDQNTTQDNSEQDADKTKTETDQTKLPFGSQRRSGAREPFEWRSYIKPSDNAKTEEDTGKQAEKDTESKLGGLLESKESAKSTETKTKEVAKSPNVAPKIDKVEVAPLPKTQIEQPKIEQPPVQQPSASVLSEPIFDMNDPDQRFLFFKELAAKRRAEKATEEAKLKQKSATKEKKDEPEKEKQVQKDVSGSTSETTKEENKKIEGKTLDLSGKIKKVDCGVKEGPTSMQSGENLETKVVTDSEKIKSKLSQPSQPASTGELAQKNQSPREIDAPECIGTQDKPKEANKASVPVDVKQVTVENQPNTTTDATSKEPQLKSSSSVPDFSKTKGLDLLSSRIYERSHLQEASKEATPKSRLWTPSIHRREFLKPFGDKQKSISTVDQIEEGTEEPSSASEASKNQASKQSAKSISENNQPQKDKTIEKSDSSGVEKTKDAKEVSLSQSLRSPTTEKPTTTISGKVMESTKESIKIEESVTSTAVKESTGPSQSLASVESRKQETVLTILDPKQTQMTKKDESSVKPSDTEIKVGTEKPSLSQSKPKTEQKQPVDPSGNDKSNAEQVEDNAQKSEKVASQQQDKMAEKSNIDAQQSTKVAGTKEVAQTIEKPDELLSTSEKVTPTKSNVETIDKNAQVATSRGKDDTKEVDSVEKKTSIATQEVVEASAESNLSKDKTDTVPLYIDDSKPKYCITYIEEVPQLESHSNTSSPASFSTALEFISSEDSDILSPKNLFKSGHLESSVSDMSDFETPNSEISISPMPSALDMDDTFEDNVSIAETVIEAASRRKASTTEEVKGAKEGDADISKSKQIESQQERQSTESLNSATAQSEAKRQDQVGITQLAKATEVTESSAVLKDSVASPASSEEKNETKMEDKPAEKAVDVKSLDPKVSVIKSDAETSSTKQSTMSPGTNVTKDVTTGGKVYEISSKGSEVSKVSTSESSKHETKPIKVYSRFQIEPSTALSETKTSTVIPPAAEVKIKDQTYEIKEQSESITEETCSEGVGPNVQESQSKTKPVESNLNDLSTMETKASPATEEAKTVDKTSEIITHETTAASENLVRKKDVSKTDVLSNASEVNKSPTSPITSKATKEPETLENAAKTTEDACKPSETANIDCQKDVSNETAPKGEKNESTTDISSSASETNQSTTSSATSEMTTEAKTSDKESNIVSIDISKSAAGGENEQTGKDTNDNTKENTESTKVSETAPSAAQPKQSKTRYLTSTANVISSSNLRDDTKILLEQISANSQTRNESNPAKEAPVTDDEKEDEADKNAKRKNDLRSSLGPQKSNQERDKLLERIQTMRKDRKVYSRFEV